MKLLDIKLWKASDAGEIMTYQAKSKRGPVLCIRMKSHLHQTRCFMCSMSFSIIVLLRIVFASIYKSRSMNVELGEHCRTFNSPYTQVSLQQKALSATVSSIALPLLSYTLVIMEPPRRKHKVHLAKVDSGLIPRQVEQQKTWLHVAALFTSCIGLS